MISFDVAPVFQEYVFPPEAVIVTVSPAQTILSVVNVKSKFVVISDTTKVAVPIQPVASVTVTE